MADSLVLAGVVELLGGGVASAVPQCAGAVFRLGRGYDLGNPQPVTELLTTLMGDGERPVGWRASNRTITMPVTILVPNTGNLAADRLTLAGARELLLQAISAEEFTLTWAPDGQAGNLNLVWDCFRARAATVTHDVLLGRQRVSEMAVTFDALPYGRSDQLVSLTFDSPVQGQAAPLPPVVIDDYSAVSTSTQASWWTQSPVTALYSNSARWHHDLSDSNSPLQYTHVLGAAVDLSNMAKVTFWLGIGADAGRFRYWRRNTPVTVAITLTDNAARTISFGTRQACNASASADWPVWNQVTATIPQGRTFTYSNVTAYSITAWSQVHTWLGRIELDATGYLSGLRASPHVSPKRPASDRGGSYTLLGVTGTAPAPLSVHCQAGTVQQVANTVTVSLPGTPGTTNNYTAPPENPGWLVGDAVDFEGGTTGSWTGADGAAANATLTASTTQAHSGTQSMRMTPVTGGTTMTAASWTAAVVTAQGVPCTAGDRIALRAWGRAGSTARNVTVGAEFFTSGGASLGIVAIAAANDSSAAWTQYSGRVTAPASAAFARMTIQVATPAAGEFHYFDDLYIAYAVQATVACVGAGGAGGTVEPAYTAAGGGGGGETAWETNLDLNPGAAHSYSAGAGGAYNRTAGGTGGTGGDSWFQGSSVQVRGHGGTGGGNVIISDYANGAAGAGGTGSTNAHHFNGGAGAGGNRLSYQGGGAGGAAGDGGAGGAASGYNPGGGGAAGSLGIAGGAGGAGARGQPVNFGSDGSAGQAPGGGGGGAACQSHERLGANGQAGLIKLRITTYTALSTFPALIVHKLSARSGLLARPVVEVGNAADPPDGREYTVDPVDGQNARYNGTYTVVLANWSWDGSAARTVTVTLRQYTSSGGSSSSVALSSSLTPSQVVNGLAVMGEVTLPVADMAPDNTDAYFTVAVTSSDTLDRFMDVVLLDTQGSMFLISMTSGGYTDYWIDAPDATADLGRVLGSAGDRSSAVSVLGSTLASGGPLHLDPGDNILTVYSPSGMPALEADYWPHWWHDRLA